MSLGLHLLYFNFENLKANSSNAHHSKNRHIYSIK